MSSTPANTSSMAYRDPQQHTTYQGLAPMDIHIGAMHPPPPVHQINGGGWKNGLCNCSPCTSCLLGCFLPCMLHGQTGDRLRDPTMQTAETVNGDCVTHGAVTYLTGCGWILGMMRRAEIRERFGIPGSATTDCCTSYWCPCCALIQQDNEVRSRLPVPDVPAGAGAGAAAGYHAQPPMQVPLPVPLPAHQHHPRSDKNDNVTGEPII